LATHTLSHRNDSSVCHVENSVLLENGSKHSLNHNAWARIADEAAFLMQLLGKEINTKIAVLASGWRRCDTDYLARTTLKDQEITNTNMVAGDCDGVRSV
jgi:hypothetical protein